MKVFVNNRMRYVNSSRSLSIKIKKLEENIINYMKYNKNNEGYEKKLGERILALQNLQDIKTACSQTNRGTATKPKGN